MLGSATAGHERRWFGKYSGTVTDNADDAKLGRIWVKVPSIFGSVHPGQAGEPGQPPDEGPAVRARPCLPFGHFYVPPTGAHVWVEFEGGHVESPIWVGVWYPEGTVPPPAAINPPDNRVIQTVSGHTVEVSDKADDEHILIKHKGNGFFSMDHHGNITIASQNGSFVSLSVADDNLTIMDKNANLLTLSGEGASVVSKGGVTIHLSDDAAHIIAPKIVLEGQSIVLGAGASEPTILATSFLTMFAAHTHGTAVGPSTPPVPPLAPPMFLNFSTSAVAVK